MNLYKIILKSEIFVSTAFSDISYAIYVNPQPVHNYVGTHLTQNALTPGLPLPGNQTGDEYAGCDDQELVFDIRG